MIAKTLQQVAAFFRRSRKYVYNPNQKEVSNYSDEELLRRAKKLEATYAQLAKIAFNLGKYTINSIDLAICFAPAEGYNWRPIARMRTEMRVDSPLAGHGSRLTVGFLGLNKKNLLDFYGSVTTFYPFQDVTTTVTTFYPFQDVTTTLERQNLIDDYVSLDYNGPTVIDIQEENFDKECEDLLAAAETVFTTVINIYEAGRKDKKKDQIVAAAKNFEV